MFKQAKAGSVEYLKAHPFLMADTALFDEAFKDALLAKIENLDESLDGLLIHGDNFQALNLLQERYREQIKCVYIDPPYNTGSDGFIYKDSYEHSSWLTMFSNRIFAASLLQSEDSWLAVSIDEREHHRMTSLLESYYGEQNIVSTVTVKMSHLSGMKMAHIDKKPPKIKEYLSLISNSVTNKLNPVYEKAEWDDVFDRYGSVLLKGINASDISEWTKLPLRQFAIKNGVNVKNTKEYDEFKHKHASIIFRTAVNDSESFNASPNDGLFHEILTPTGLKKYAHNREEVLFAIDKLKIIDGKLEPAPVKIKGDIWEDIGINNLHNEGAVIMPNGKKPVKLIERVCRMFTSPTDLVLDYFSGSGTTGHAVINLNREDNGQRKYILVEQGEYFDTVLKPRIQKVVYSADWKDGKATAPQTGISHAFKVLKIESYEDTLNNLQLRRTEAQQSLLDTLPDTAHEDYLLRYLLDIESRGSVLSVAQFNKPFDCKLKVAVDSAGAYEERNIDLVETFNYLIGLRVKHIDMQRDKGYVWVSGWLPTGEKTLVLWRDVEQVDYETLNRLCNKLAINPADSEFEIVYINGDHNIPAVFTSLETEGGITKTLKIRQVEPEFLSRMFAVDGE